MRIVISGSIAFDYLMPFPGRFVEHILPTEIDHLSVSFLVDTMEKRRGGVAPNIAYTLALLGERPVLVGTAGEDFADYRAWLEKHGVDTSGVMLLPDVFTASFFVTTDLDNHQIATFYTGAMAYSHQIALAESAGRDADLVVVSPDAPRAMIQRVQECQTLGIPYWYDPSQQIIRLSGEELAAGIEGCHLLVVNEYEFAMIREKTGWTEEQVRKKAGGVAITLAERGALLVVQDEEHWIPPVPPNPIVEPTGAGDAFRAGLLRGHSLNLGWDIAGRMGTLAAAYVLEQTGTQTHHYTRQDFVSRYRDNFDDQGALDVLLEGEPAFHPA
jgi:adenosine kinase